MNADKIFPEDKGINKAVNPENIFPIILIIKLKQFWHRLVLVNPLSEVPKIVRISKLSKARIKEKIKTAATLSIVPLKNSKVKIREIMIEIAMLVKILLHFEFIIKTS